MPISSAEDEFTSCLISPELINGQSLRSQAEKCGKEALSKELIDMYGINPTDYITSDGKPDWEKIASAVISYETGVPTEVKLFNEKGEFDWKEVAGTAGGVAAAAVCTAYGAGAVAPLCSAVGNVLGKAFYDVGSDFIEMFKSKDAPIKMIYSVDKSIDAVVQWYMNYERQYLANELAIRAIALATISTVEKLRAYETQITGVDPGFDGVYNAMSSLGLKAPNGWAYAIGASADVDTTYVAYDSENNVFETDVMIGTVAYLGFHADGAITQYDDRTWYSKNIGFLRPSTASSTWERTFLSIGALSNPDDKNSGVYQVEFVLDPSTPSPYSIHFESGPSLNLPNAFPKNVLNKYGGKTAIYWDLTKNPVSGNGAISAVIVYGGKSMHDLARSNQNEFEKTKADWTKSIVTATRAYHREIRKKAQKKLSNTLIKPDALRTIDTSPKSKKGMSTTGKVLIWTALGLGAYAGYRVYKNQPVLPKSVTRLSKKAKKWVKGTI